MSKIEMTEIIQALDLHRHAQDLRRTWQARALAESRDKTNAVMEAALWHSYAEAMPILLRVVYPQQRGQRYPHFVSCAKIAKSGHVCCLMQYQEGGAHRVGVVFDSQNELIKTFRKLADSLKLPDGERIEMIETVKRWIVADQRIDHLGRKLAS